MNYLMIASSIKHIYSYAFTILFICVVLANIVKTIVTYIFSRGELDLKDCLIELGKRLIFITVFYVILITIAYFIEK